MRRNCPEQDAQRAIVAHLKARAAPGLYWFHPANGGARTAIEGAILQGLGVRAGCPDLILVRNGKTFALELKAPHGRLSPSQRQAHEELRLAGAEVAVAVGVDEAIAALEQWGMLKGHAQ